MSQPIDISNLSKAEVLAALYNNSRPLGLGWLHYDPKPMTTEQAQKLIDEQLSDPINSAKEIWFDYLQGRVMKIDLTGDSLNPRLYDRDNGDGAALKVLQHLLKIKAA